MSEQSVPRNRLTKEDVKEVLKYFLSVKSVKAFANLLGWYVHDHVAPKATLRCGENISLGLNSHINQYCCIWASKNSKIVLGDNLLMGPGVKIFSSNHSSKLGIPMNVQHHVEKDILIGNDVWLC